MEDSHWYWSIIDENLLLKGINIRADPNRRVIVSLEDIEESNTKRPKLSLEVFVFVLMREKSSLYAADESDGKIVEMENECNYDENFPFQSRSDVIRSHSAQIATENVQIRIVFRSGPLKCKLNRKKLVWQRMKNIR